MNITIDKFGYPGTLIKEFNHWVVLLRPQQVTLGSLVIASKSEFTQLSQLTKEEWSEFAETCQFSENLVRDTFGAEKFNYLALMMKDPNVHFHFIPRYSKPVLFDGKEYADTDWPVKTELKPIDLITEVVEKIKKKLLENK
jgi:diadenosine tetraphosphate (Ap4A) HIT family hydrolase